ncbi:hypothetical protein ACFVIM_00555 [Streptomyces sp. NPDC057638]|uniref:hypothetical protein n=1 Tax=Streptomyces sp. NPDC057638 TaxID=3346190 RepID=UPI0036A012F9
MEIDKESQTEVKRVRIASEGTIGSLEIDGVDCSRYVSAYALRHTAGEPPLLVVELAPARVSPHFDGCARVAVGVPYEPGEAAARFLSAIDPSLLERAAMARPDLRSDEHGYTASVLTQLQEWARGEFGESEGSDDIAA